MAGIERITQEILDDASREADAILKKAQEAVDAKAAKAEADREQVLAGARAKAEKDADLYAERIVSQCDRIHREAVLMAKQEEIQAVMQSAYEKLISQSTEDYFAMLEKLLEKNVQAMAGLLFLGKRDLDRLPAGFKEHVSLIARKAGGSIEISGTPEPIENGFILRYGGIDENCTLGALFAEKKEILEDKAHEALW
ncbi:MAG: V-type ATP synthase subunit E [Lachnospiraceae bacterium]|nr:V-type ATP synthase subunit E [Lachnospiraceae bacterium]